MAKTKLSSTVRTEQTFRAGMTTAELIGDYAAVARFLGKYCSHYYAGAFAHATRSDMEKGVVDVEIYGEGDSPTVVTWKVSGRATRKRDYTGDNFEIPAGARVATLVARDHMSPVPDLTDFDYVTIYSEDHVLRDSLEQLQGFRRAAVRMTPQAEVIGLYAGPEMPVREYSAFDSATVQQLPVPVPEADRDAFLEEVDGLDTLGGWRDDVPFYNEGAWGSLSLRGFWPEDPTRGSKPGEMSKAYKAEHPEDAFRECDWTVITDACPTIVSWVRSLPWMPERVRIVRLKGDGGELERHTDGTRNRDFTRLHIPLITNPGAKLHNWDLDGNHLQTWLEPFNVYYLDTRKPHAVTNTSTADRIHLVVDLHSEPSLHELIGEAWKVMPDSRGDAEALWLL